MKQQQAAAAERAAACGMCTLVAVSDFFKTKYVLCFKSERQRRATPVALRPRHTHKTFDM